uniref:Link domain-containing protein n=1 Tax=Maylandia zebra TaxID=106582 RepID=A0A3P9CIN8_9CICH
MCRKQLFWLFTVICSTGEVFHIESAEGFTYSEAVRSCQEQNATAASTGHLYAAWKMGFDKCRAGWLLDRSVRYPINNPRAECGAGKIGVHTVYNHQTGYPELDSYFFYFPTLDCEPIRSLTYCTVSVTGSADISLIFTRALKLFNPD